MGNNKRVELLAPARDKECAIAAIESGADAIYIGAPNFGARQNASNSLDDLKEIVDYAHRFYVKVHVTINTILSDDELKSAQKLIEKLYEIGVDAIIVQDMGILKLAVDGKLPPIPLHASTQCDNRTIEKVSFFKKLGLPRVILARELSLEQIKEICLNTKPSPRRSAPFLSQSERKNNFNKIVVETFIHGALCVSYSGQCYMSAAIGGRSANRGECAQPCRKKYTVVDENGIIIAKDKYLLCLKDFNASSHLKELIDAGVKSFKIEGRLKGPDYVKNITSFYRREIDKISGKTSSGEVFLDFEPDLNKSFNRGFTDYFLEGRKKSFNLDTQKALGENLGKVKNVGKNWFLIDADLNNGDGLCFFDNGELKGCLVNKVDGNKIYPSVIDGIKPGITIYRNKNTAFEKQLANSKTKRRIKAEIEISSDCIIAVDEDNNRVQVPLSMDEESRTPEKMRENYIKQFKKTGESDFYVENIKITSRNLPFIPVSGLNELRRTLLENLMEERIKNYPREIQNPLNYTKFPLDEMDYHANVHNSLAKEFYENCGCNITEMSFESTGQTKGKTLMHTKHCIKYALNMCKSSKKLFLIDEKGKKYKLQFDCKNCEMKIINL